MTWAGTVTMSAKELNRLEVLGRVWTLCQGPAGDPEGGQWVSASRISTPTLGSP